MELFHPVIEKWFRDRYGEPTEIQRLAWPAIAAGEHILLTAPTGSGKTLAAFLWAIHSLFAGEISPGAIRILYVSPLKALNSDVEKNLSVPLREIKEAFHKEGLAVPDIRAAVRSGDSTATERRQILRHPPEILITTPESLNILLTSPRSRGLFAELQVVILDEIHSVASTKRGIHLLTAVERLTLQAGEIQRIALSATVRPVERVARLVGGYRTPDGGKGEKGGPGRTELVARPVRILHTSIKKEYELHVVFPVPFSERDTGSPPGPGARSSDGQLHNRMEEREILPAADRKAAFQISLLESIREEIGRNRSTLVFTNSRRMAEKLTRLLNEGGETPLAYSHHGSLSLEMRRAVEARLKEGSVPAVVATSSLELGIDPGELDSVCLVETPPTFTSAIQRIGRAGHGVGATSRALYLATHGMDLLMGALSARAVQSGLQEELKIPESPLDLLAQVVLSMACERDWETDELYHFFLRTESYHRLERRAFDSVLEMLAGRYEGTRIPELRPRIVWDRSRGTIRAREGSERLLYLAGGTIPDRGLYRIVVSGSGASLGELDEEFVWERTEGEIFTFASGCWRILEIRESDVVVEPAGRNPDLYPFYKADSRDSSHFLARELALVMDRLAAILDRMDGLQVGSSGPSAGSEPGGAPPGEPFSAVELLQRDYFLDPASAWELLAFLRRQRDASAGMLPGSQRILVEEIMDPAMAGGEKRIVFHTLAGGSVNRALALLLKEEVRHRVGIAAETAHDDTAILLMTPAELRGSELLRAVAMGYSREGLRNTLRSTGFFASQFRMNAGVALLLPRRDFRRRTPFWWTRLRARKLQEALAGYPDFPVLLETWRTLLCDQLEPEALEELLADVREGAVDVKSFRTTRPSPFCDHLFWKQTSVLMYELDAPAATAIPAFDPVAWILGSGEERPQIPVEEIGELEAKLQRTHPDWQPSGTDELLDFLEERRLIPLAEWKRLLSLQDEADAKRISRELEKRINMMRFPGAGLDVVVSSEELPRIQRDLQWDTGIPHERQTAFAKDDSKDARRREGVRRILLRLLRYYGPVDPSFPSQILGDLNGELPVVLWEMVREGTILDLRENGLCLSENYEILLRRRRARRRLRDSIRPVSDLALFLARRQNILTPGVEEEGLKRAMEGLFGLPVAASLWETEVLPVRVADYRPAHLDSLLASSDLLWFGTGKESLAFALPEDRELFSRDFVSFGRYSIEKRGVMEREKEEILVKLFPDPVARYGFFDLMRGWEGDSKALAEFLWEAVWAGRVSSDSFEPVRRGIEGKFGAPAASELRHPSRRSGMDRWSRGRVQGGEWRLLPNGVSRSGDPLASHEWMRERIRLLLDRYGILFRELLVRELPVLQWKSIWPVLRIMELSGEVMAGRFFEGSSGIQFLAPELLSLLEGDIATADPYRLHAMDPASPCGLEIQGVEKLPPRMRGIHCTYARGKMLLYSRRNGSDLQIPGAIPGEDTLPDVNMTTGDLIRLHYLPLVKRRVRPLSLVRVETINGESALRSPLGGSLLLAGFQRDYGGYVLRREV